MHEADRSYVRTPNARTHRQSDTVEVNSNEGEVDGFTELRHLDEAEEVVSTNRPVPQFLDLRELP